MNRLLNFSNEDVISLLIGIQNVQLEMMQMLQGVQLEVANMSHEVAKVPRIQNEISKLQEIRHEVVKLQNHQAEASKLSHLEVRRIEDIHLEVDKIKDIKEELDKISEKGDRIESLLKNGRTLTIHTDEHDSVSTGSEENALEPETGYIEIKPEDNDYIPFEEKRTKMISKEESENSGNVKFLESTSTKSTRTGVEMFKSFFHKSSEEPKEVSQESQDFGLDAVIQSINDSTEDEDQSAAQPSLALPQARTSDVQPKVSVSVSNFDGFTSMNGSESFNNSSFDLVRPKTYMRNSSSKRRTDNLIGIRSSVDKFLLDIDEEILDESLLLQEDESNESAFASFVYVSVDSKNPFTSRISKVGANRLDKFTFNTGFVCDQYPRNAEFMEDDAIFPYCFPQGLSFRIIPRCAIPGAKRLGWMGRAVDRYQLHSFQNAKGDKTVGIAITINDEMKLSNIEDLKDQHAQYLAAFKLVSSWRNYRRPNLVRRSFMEGFRALGDEKDPRKKGKGAKSTPSQWALQKAAESYQIMIRNFENGYVCIVEQSYVLIDVQTENLSILFSALQNLIEFEGVEKENLERRHLHLDDMRKKLYLTKEQKLIAYPDSEWEHAYFERPHLEIQLDDPLDNIEANLPLPHLSKEWGIARLILRVKLPNLIILLKLLLLERSVFVIGDSYEEVSSCAFALIDLLKPYQWNSVFIPSLSVDMMDFISSPVPFIAGATRHKSAFSKIENSSRPEMMNGLNIINLTEGKILWTELEVDKTKFLAHCKSIRNFWYRSNELMCYQKRLESLAENKTSSLRSFKKFFQEGLSERESVVLKSIRDSVQKYLTNLAGLLTQYSDGWMVCDKKDEISQERVFVGKKFIRPLNHQLEYQKELSKCQLLACYYDERKKEYEDYIRLRNKRVALFIYDWVCYKWIAYKNNDSNRILAIIRRAKVSTKNTVVK